MKRPEAVTLSREDGKALIERLVKDALTAEDRQVLVKVLRFYSGCSAAALGMHPTSAPEPLELTFFNVGCMRQFTFIER